MARLYLMNSPVLTDYGLWRFHGPLNRLQARELVTQGCISAIGHEGAAQLLSRLLQIKIQTSRIQVHFSPGDKAVVLRLKQRLPEGRVLSKDELKNMAWELALLERLE